MVKKSGLIFFLSVFAVAFGNVANAQDYSRTINWSSTSKSIFTYDGNEVKQPSFSNAIHDQNTGFLPNYVERIAGNFSGKVVAELVNVSYSVVGSVDANSIKFISNEPYIKAQLSYQRKSSGVMLEIFPFRRNQVSGQIEKIESFSIRIKTTPLPQQRAATAFAPNSKLASGTWYKIAVTSTGVFKINFDFVKTTLKLNPQNVSLNKLAIFGNGGGMVPAQNSANRFDDIQENPTMIYDQNGNNRMDEADYLIFYGEMPDAWKWDATNQTFSHEKNLYSDKNYYYLTTDAGTGLRISQSQQVGNPNKTITEFDDYFFHESDEESLLSSGKVWLGDRMTSFSSSKSFQLNFPNIITSSQVKFISRVAVNTRYGASISVAVNNQNIISHSDNGITPSNYQRASNVYQTSVNFSTSTSQLNIGYSFAPNSDPSGTATGYIDWFEVFAKRSLTMSGDFMPFRSISSVGSGSVSNFQVANSNGSVRVWDVSDVSAISEMPGSLNGSVLSFNAATDNMRQFAAVNITGSFPAPEYVGEVSNQNLHALGQPDMLIISHDNFVSAANELAAFHRTYDNLSVEVVRTSNIYNEFGCGKADISAIRDFVKMFYDRAGSDVSLLPQYILLFGDGSYDPKDREPEKTNFIPTYQSIESNDPLSSYTSDDYFGLLDPNEGGEITNIAQQLDVAIGRLPVETETEAWDVVNKIKNYKRPQPDASCAQVNANGGWRNIVTFIADDEDNDVHFDSSDLLAETTRASHPEYNYEKIHLDAFKQVSTPAGDRYPDVNTAILNRINSGTLIVNWVGHGGETNWAHERIFNMSDIVQLSNKEKLPFFITATCDFSRFDAPHRTAGEWLVVNGKGGAIGSITTVRLVFSSANAALNNRAFDYIFAPLDNRSATLGEIATLTKNNANTDITNTRKFVLLGDPALKLNYPQLNVITTSVNNKPIDTLKALSLVEIKGEIRDDNGNKVTSFNGVVYPTVYDKIVTLRTIGNDAGSPLRNFKLYKNLLFRGKASVTNGDFTFSFIVPKDIDYQYGNGRISYYADNGNYLDAQGYTNSLIIGGAADSFSADANGPEMKIFMNDEKFVFGGTTNSEPLLLVKLFDESGINTVGNGIGHDLTAILDDNTQSRVVLNEYYETALDSFRTGEVRYPFSKLKEGRHTLKVKAWDIQNNSSEDYTEFVVASDAKLALSHVYNYPNPFTTHTKFMFEHNRCCDVLNVSVQIYTVSGRLVKSIVEQLESPGYRVDDIEWDGLDDYGDPIGKGVYVYKIAVRDSQGQSAHKFEKLVVLR